MKDEVMRGKATKIDATIDSMAEKLVLTDDDLAQINVRSRLELVHVVIAQACVGVFVALLAWWVGGFDAGWSALAGSTVYFVPNTLFALRLF